MILDEVGSALDAAAALPVMPAWVMARRQTAGRGRRGRPWLAPEGNFAAALAFEPGGDAADAALRSFTAALALVDAFAAVGAPLDAFSLKWPNDVLLNGGKVAGILLESRSRGRVVDRLCVGVGANLADAPDAGADGIENGSRRPVSLLGETGIRVEPEEFLTRVAAAHDHWEGRFAAEGFAPAREAWLALAARPSGEITARTGKESVTGRFETVDNAGNLVLETVDGRLAIPAAEVYF